MAWVFLAAAAVFEVVFALSMKYADGFTRLGPSIATGLSVMASMGFLTLAMKTLPVSIAYPIWTAVGTLGVVLFGFLWLGEPLTGMKMASTLAIVSGVVGLKLSTA